MAALKRNRTARNRHQPQQARDVMRTWQVERRKRTRHLIELGGLVVKAGIVDPTGDDRTIIYGAMIWIAEKLKSDQGEHARGVWTELGKMAFEMERPTGPERRSATAAGSDEIDGGRRGPDIEDSEQSECKERVQSQPDLIRTVKLRGIPPFRTPHTCIVVSKRMILESASHGS